MWTCNKRNIEYTNLTRHFVWSFLCLKLFQRKGNIMTILEKKEALEKELLKVKSEGLRVFISKSSDYAYGLITDGKNIIYIQFADYFYGFKTTFEYVPKRSTGSGCATLDKGYCYKELNKDIFLEAVYIGKERALYQELYRSFEHYLKIHPDFYRFYKEL